MLSCRPENRFDPFGREPGPARVDGTTREALTPRESGSTMTLTFDAHPRSSLIVALDFDSLSTAVKFAKQVADLVGMFKIGNQLFTAAGPAAVKEVAALGTGVFLDLKFHDIPNTVAGAVLSAAAMTGVQLVNVHALGGKAMLEAAVQAIRAAVPMGADRPRLRAVTILTSMGQDALKECSTARTPQRSAAKQPECG